MATVNHTDPYAKKMFRGVTLDNRTISALLWAEKKYRRRGLGRKSLMLAQGSYNKGGVAVSAGTHDGGGAVDVSVNGMSVNQRKAVVKWLRKAGFAAWYRPAMPGVWGPHIHAILLNHRTAASGAQDQMRSYRAHRNGLANNAWDTTWRPNPIPVWSHRQNKPVKK